MSVQQGDNFYFIISLILLNTGKGKFETYFISAQHCWTFRRSPLRHCQSDFQKDILGYYALHFANAAMLAAEFLLFECLFIFFQIQGIKASNSGIREKCF